jgi:hypothetical protein
VGCPLDPAEAALQHPTRLRARFRLEDRVHGEPREGERAEDVVRETIGEHLELRVSVAEDLRLPALEGVLLGVEPIKQQGDEGGERDADDVEDGGRPH